MKSSEVIFAKEELTDELIAELHPAITAHQAEFDGGVFDPDWSLYKTIQLSGALHIYTARIDGLLVGYIAYIIQFHLHQKTVLSAMQDGLYIRPDHRRGRLAIRLIKFSEAGLLTLGVDIVGQCSSVQNNVTPLYERLGYVPAEIFSMKRLRD